MINRDYQYMKRFFQLQDLTIEENSLYLYGHDDEYRASACAKQLMQSTTNVAFVELEYIDKDLMYVCGSTEKPITLRSGNALSEFFKKYGFHRIYIDVSGMEVRMVAALLLRAVEERLEVHVIYAEPQNYITEKFHKEGADQEWAGNIDGIEPLPGFVNFATSNDEFLFCVFLGFEGGRFRHMISQMQPMDDLTFPVYGIPGFRIEYPYNAYWSNHKGMTKTQSAGNVKYASANSIVDAYLLLERISKANKGIKMLVAPIGTKPHTIASIAFAIKYFKDVEIVYDNPKKIESRSEGIGNIFDCHLSKLMEDNS